jgi:hypothetical protein
MQKDEIKYDNLIQKKWRDKWKFSIWLKSVMNMLHLDYTTPCVFKQDIKEKFLDV